MTNVKTSLNRARIGFIGAGFIANRHIDQLSTFDDAQVVAVSDTLIERAEAQAQRVNARAYMRYEEMLDKEQLDAVYVCVPPFAHGPVERVLIEKGLPFFAEKPLAVDAATAEETAELIRSRNLTTAVGYHWRYLDTVEEARSLLADNPARLALGYWLDFTPPPGWWSHQEQSGGQMVEQTTHIFDLARLLIGDVNFVFAMGEVIERDRFPDQNVYNVSTASLRFDTGAIGTIASTCLLNWPHRIGLHLFSEGMAIELSEFDLMIDVGNGRPVRRAEGNAFWREDRDFIDAVLGRENRIRVPYAEALKTHRLTMSAMNSINQKRGLNIDLNQPLKDLGMGVSTPTTDSAHAYETSTRT